MAFQAKKVSVSIYMLIAWIGLMVMIGIFCYHEIRQRDTFAYGLLDDMKRYAQRIHVLETVSQNRIYEVSRNGIPYPPDLYVTDVQGNRKMIKDIVNGNRLVLRYSELNCGVCVEEQIKALNQYANSIGVDNILLLTTYQSEIYMRRFKKANKIKFPIYQLSSQGDSIFKDLGLPYFFTLTPNDNRISNMYIPLEDNPEHTNKYLDKIRNDYFKEE